MPHTSTGPLQPALRAKSPKTIIISHVYSSDNKGDAALVSVLIQDLKRVFPGAAVTILKLEGGGPQDYFEGIPERPSFMYYALNKYRQPLLKLIYTLYMLSATLAWAVGKRLAGRSLYLPAHLRTVAATYAAADLIVPVGGGYLRSRQGLMNRMNVPLLLHPLLFASVLGKPTILYPQSVGPFQNKAEKLLVAFVLKKMTRIFLREDTSVKLLADMGVRRNISRAIDSGFLLQSARTIKMRDRYGIPPGTLLIGVTVRAWLSGAAQEHYEKAVATALDNIIKLTGAHVIFIPQVTAAKGDDDRIVSRRVQALMHETTNTTLVTDEPDHTRIKALYDTLDILLGTRFHSVIFSLTSFVPVVAIEYEHKTSGIMHDLKLDAWVIKFEDTTALQLTRLLQQVVQRRDSYRAYLQICMPSYIRQAKHTALALAGAYASKRRRTNV